jgi:hypothetical protein
MTGSEQHGFACLKCADEFAASSDCFAELGVFFKAVDRELEKLSQFTASQCELRLAHTCTRCCSLKTVHVPLDLASLVCGLSVAALAVRLRWLGIAMCALGAAGPVLVGFALHWVTGGVGQFALAYQWPLWACGSRCGTAWDRGCLCAMQRDIAWMALRQFSTLWIIAMTGFFVAGWVHLSEFGVRRSTWVVLPCYLVCGLLFPLVAMAGALPPAPRLLVLHFGGPFAFAAVGAMALVLRLPTAENMPGRARVDDHGD